MSDGSLAEFIKRPQAVANRREEAQSVLQLTFDAMLSQVTRRHIGDGRMQPRVAIACSSLSVDENQKPFKALSP